jgi:hypothetical protein
MVTTVAENRPRAATVVGTEAAARAASDGNTLLITDTSIVTRAASKLEKWAPRMEEFRAWINENLNDL